MFKGQKDDLNLSAGQNTQHACTQKIGDLVYPLIIVVCLSICLCVAFTQK